MRALEAAARDAEAATAARCGDEHETDIFITPGYAFRVVDRLVTQFPSAEVRRLLMLVSAFAGVETIRAAYRHAIEAALSLLQLRRRDASDAAHG